LDSKFSGYLYATLPDTSILSPKLEDLSIYYWRVRAETPFGTTGWSVVSSFATIDGVNILRKGEATSKETTISEAYPNPGRGKIRFDVVVSDWTKVLVRVYDMTGREMATLFDKLVPPGVYEIAWVPDHAPTGVYFCRSVIRGVVTTKKILYLK
jgi:hypothetical protein